MLNQATGQYLSKASVTHWIRSTLEELLWIFGSLFKCKCVLEEASAKRVQSGGAVKLWWRLKCVGSCFFNFFFSHLNLHFPPYQWWETERERGFLETTQSELTERFQVSFRFFSILSSLIDQKEQPWRSLVPYSKHTPIKCTLSLCPAVSVRLGLGPVYSLGL